ncbi:MAG: NAD(P)H-hydrate dehydratase [Casimicrobiaceae bacterium]|nr:NAD(P)H-hydrate dehydratase [Casimicrobiaceae bacterium]MDW8311288.1 NAD(P)H-hydrate dehydratase [Burkholderiales bacterium]
MSGACAVLDTRAHREIEQKHAGVDLMRRAGEAAAAWLAERLSTGQALCVLAGPGNNGGDALVAASCLRERGFKVTLVRLATPDRLPADAQAALARWNALGHETLGRWPDTFANGWIVDGLFGIGLQRPIEGVYAEAVRWIARQRAAGARVLALDVPSGVEADTGAVVGEAVVSADATLTFIAAKPGLLTGPALEHVGEAYVHDLGLGPLPADPRLAAFGLEQAQALAPARPRTAHKGSFGEVHVLGGAEGMWGAAILAARAAARAGAGKVRVGWLSEAAPGLDPLAPELMLGPASRLVAQAADALCVGCGLGVSGAAVQLLRRAIEREVPTLFDADALNLIAQSAELATAVQRRKAPSILTPHPLEAARLLGASPASVNADRLRAARDLARGYRAVVVLKGAGSVVADPEGRASINLTGNPLLATAGTGDVLAGVIAALLAQRLPAWDAARVGVAWHGACADRLATQGVQRALASDLLPELRFLR